MNRCAVILSSLLCLNAQTALADSDSSNNCGKLTVSITNNTHATCHLVWERLHHGYYHYSSSPAAFIPPGITSHPVTLSQSMYGPSLELRYQCGNKSITFNSQQNLCVFSAGAIHDKILETTNMSASAFKREGSYLWSQHGSIQWILQ